MWNCGYNSLFKTEDTYYTNYEPHTNITNEGTQGRYPTNEIKD
ncbi:MAG: hypothetical protein UT32_C0034G0010 [Parcubacteria group bacterium GW2011_GWC2_39_14]|nr:MAG: hypothetical protein UT32_C0034G0010 [Parcubacteria group bacterium GW2011_GWC2_39_14]